MNWYKIAQQTDMPKRKFGKTNCQVGILSLGGQGSLEIQGNEKNCVEIIQRAYDLGINYFDTSPMYGPSEDYYGKALKGFRKKIFLASKTDKRDRDGALKDIEKSLKRLKTDYLDLWQIHHLDDMKELDELSGNSGALKACEEMKEQGVIKFCGLTGHEHPDVLLEMMDRHDFDTILCPVNAGDCHMNPSFADTVLKKAAKKKMGIIGMKVFSQGFIFHPKGITTVWEPINYALAQPISTIIVGHDTVEQLEENVAIAKGFTGLDDDVLKDIEGKTEKYKRRVSFFRRQYGGYDSREELSEPYTRANYELV